MRGRSLTALALAGVLAFSACGDDDDDTTTGTGATEETSAATDPAATTAMTEGTMAPGTTAGSTPAAAGDIVAVAASTAGFGTLVAAVTAADLVGTLQGPGPFTVFAPTDDAFAALPEGVLDALLLPENKATLAKILTYHVLPAEVLAADVTAGDVATVEGQTVAISTDGGVMVNDANVTVTDVPASNGVIHAIDAVLIPPDVDPSTLVS